jgi:RNA polymerase sigma-70 factor (ECF subfamily)
MRANAPSSAARERSPSARTETSANEARLRALLDEHARFVARALRRAGVPRSEVDDQVQRTFITAAGRIDDMQQGAERSFLFQVAIHKAAHMRRTLMRRRETSSDHLPERIEPVGSPEDLTQRKQMGALLEQAVGAMNESLRSVIVLYELEEMDTHEIAALLGVPRGTVASRLRRARAQLRRNLAAIELAWEFGITRDVGVEGPEPLSRERLGRLAKALLSAGAATPTSVALRAQTLTACLAARP